MAVGRAERDAVGMVRGRAGRRGARAGEHYRDAAPFPVVPVAVLEGRGAGLHDVCDGVEYVLNEFPLPIVAC
jgi:hypothetical protein